MAIMISDTQIPFFYFTNDAAGTACATTISNTINFKITDLTSFIMLTAS